MNTKYLIYLSILIFISCKKKDPSETKVKTCNLIGVVTPTNKKLLSIEYNSDGKISKVANYDTVDSKVKNTTSYEYAPGLVSRKYNQNGSIQSDYDYYLNEKGAAYMRIGKKLNDTVLFFYNGNNQLIESKNWFDIALYAQQMYAYDGDKRILLTNNLDNPKEKRAFSYYDFEIPKNVKNVLSMSSNLFGDPIDREIFLGSNTNLAVKNREIWFVGDTIHQQVYVHEYIFDENKRLNSIKVTVSYKYSYVLYKEEVFMKYDCK